MASFSKTKQCKTKQGNHLLTAQLLPWSYRMPTEIVYKCIKPCLRVYRFFILIPFVVFYKLFKALWAQFLREEGGLLSPFQILILGSGQPTRRFLQHNLLHIWPTGGALSLGSGNAVYKAACGSQGSKTKLWGRKYPKVSKAKAAVWSFLTFL